MASCSGKKSRSIKYFPVRKLCRAREARRPLLIASM